jgi:Tfp pilus assembly protein PilV
MIPDRFQNEEAQRGFTLLIAVILTSVILSVGLALLDMAYKQTTLSSSARQSQYAFYAADAAMECALYADQKQNVFYYDFPGAGGNPALNIVCQGQNVSSYTASQSGGVRTTSFQIPCAGGGIRGSVTVYKNQTGVTSIYANGYNSCNTSDPRRVERGLRASY